MSPLPSEKLYVCMLCGFNIYSRELLTRWPQTVGILMENILVVSIGHEVQDPLTGPASTLQPMHGWSSWASADVRRIVPQHISKDVIFTARIGRVAEPFPQWWWMEEPPRKICNIDNEPMRNVVREWSAWNWWELWKFGGSFSIGIQILRWLSKLNLCTFRDSPIANYTVLSRSAQTPLI